MAGALPTLVLWLLAAPQNPDALDPSSTTPPAAAPGAPTDGDPPIVLTWIAPEGCPGVEDLRAEIRRLAGPVPPPPEKPEARAFVRRGPKDSWMLTLNTTAGLLAGERRLTAGDCDELMRAAALVMALMLNPSAGALPPPPPPPPPPPVVIATPPAPPPPSPPGPISLGAEVLVGTGLLPGGAAPGLGLRLGLGAGVLSVELRAAVWSERSAQSPLVGGAGGTFDLIDGDLAGCATARRHQRIALGACLGVMVWRGTGSGTGVSDPATATAYWPGGFADGNLRFRVTLRNAVRLGVGAFLPFGRPTFALGGVGDVWQPSKFGARGTAGWELNF